ncbi:hypothetical protein ACPEER_05310 [Pasteurella sp. PK-2025]
MSFDSNYSHQELKQKGLSEHQIHAIDQVAQHSQNAKESYKVQQKQE